MCKGALPLDRQGTHALPILPVRPIVEQYLEQKNIDNDILIDHFGNMFTSTIESIAKKEYDNLEKLLEKRFYKKVLDNKEMLERFNLNYDLNKVDANESEIVDKLFIKGVYHDRDLNGINYDYLLIN